MISQLAHTTRECTVFALVLTAFGTAMAQANLPDTIRTNLGDSPNNFVSFRGTTETSYTVSSLLYARLIYRNPQGGIVGGLAESWRATPTEVNFQIRKNLKCSDGTTLKPSDIAASLKAYADPRTGAANAVSTFGPNNTPAISANDSTGTVSIKLQTPWSDMLDGLTEKAAGIVCPAGLSNLESAAAGEVKGAFSGPYSLVAVEPNQRYTLELTNPSFPWPDYMTKLKGVPPKKIVFNILPDDATTANLLLTNSLDIATVSGASMERLKREERIKSTNYDFGFFFLQFNERSGSPFTEKKNRLAVAQAVNKSGFNKAASAGMGTLLTSVVSDAAPCALDDKQGLIKFDPNAARNSLSAMPQTTLLSTIRIGPSGAGGKYLSAVLTEAGAQVKLLNPPTAEWLKLMRTPSSWDLLVQVSINPGRTVYGGIARIMGTPAESGGWNLSGGEQDKEMQELLKSAMGTTDQAQKCANLKALQARAIQEVHIIPLATVPATINSRPGFAAQPVAGMSEPLTMRILSDAR